MEKIHQVLMEYSLSNTSKAARKFNAMWKKEYLILLAFCRSFGCWICVLCTLATDPNAFRIIFRIWIQRVWFRVWVPIVYDGSLLTRARARTHACWINRTPTSFFFYIFFADMRLMVASSQAVHAFNIRMRRCRKRIRISHVNWAERPPVNIMN